MKERNFVRANDVDDQRLGQQALDEPAGLKQACAVRRRLGRAGVPALEEVQHHEIGGVVENRRARADEDDEARELAKRALQFKNERGRLPELNSADAWEKRMAEGVAALARYRAQAKAKAQGESSNG